MPRRARFKGETMRQITTTLPILLIVGIALVCALWIVHNRIEVQLQETYWGTSAGQ